MRWSIRWHSLGGQIVVVTCAVTAVGVVLLTVLTQMVLAHVTGNDVDRILQERVDAVVSAVSVDDSGQLVLKASQLDAGGALFDDRGRLVAGTVPANLSEALKALSTVEERTVLTADGHSRLQAEPFATANGAEGVAVVAERLEPYEEAERLALLVSLSAGLLTTVAAGLIAAWATRHALRPVTAMAATASEWSEHDLTRRFGLGPPANEIAELGGTLDQLLDKVASAIRAEQRLTAELAHELRTPLTTIHGTAQLVLLRDALPDSAVTDVEEISAASQRMAATITALLDLARNGSRPSASTGSSLREVLAEVASSAGPHSVRLVVDVPDALIDLPHTLAVRTLSPVVENAFRLARTRVRVTARLAAGRSVEIIVEDDGPGGEAAEVETIFHAGTTSTEGSGAGLGLAIARRIARSAGGDVTVELGGSDTRFVVRLPHG